MRYQDIITRLEKLTGPDREVDIAIKRDVIGFDPDHDLPAHIPDVNGSVKPFYGCAPHYTSSIDAALTLVPEGAAATPTCGGPFGMARISLKPTDDQCWRTSPLFVCEGAATAAIALCIAALKALSLTSAKGELNVENCRIEN